MSNRLFQGLVHQMRDCIDRIIGVVDETGTIIACSDLSRIGEVSDYLAIDLGENNDVFVRDGNTYKPFGSKMTSEYAVFVGGSDEPAEKYCNLLAVSLANIKQYYDEKYDRNNFIKNVILDNILPGDIYIKSREMQFQNESKRVVYLIHMAQKQDVAVVEMLQKIFPDRQHDFAITINETEVVLVKELRSSDSKEINKYGKQIDAGVTEAGIDHVVGIGSVANQLKDIARSFKEAQVAVEIGRVFDESITMMSYENLGIGRLIYQLPTTLCEMFLSEVFKKGSVESLDEETLFTIQKFFENNLNVSETSRKLFVHRNTLVYRLEKIKKLTGLDLREFDNAIVLKVALMVKQYLRSRENF